MNKRIQIGNLGSSIDDRDLTRLFARFGAVRSAHVSVHYDSNLSTGVGFVEMESDEEGDAATKGLNGQSHCGRILSVCWSDASQTPDEIEPAMFGPMNISDAPQTTDDNPERRGLP